PWLRWASAVRSAGATRSEPAIGPSPRPPVPWQLAQYDRNRASPLSTVATATATVTDGEGEGRGEAAAETSRMAGPSRVSMSASAGLASNRDAVAGAEVSLSHSVHAVLLHHGPQWSS